MTDRDSKSKSQQERRLAEGWSQGLPPQNGDLGPYSGLDEQLDSSASAPSQSQAQAPPRRSEWTAAPQPEFIPPRRGRRETPDFESLGRTSEVLQTETEGRIRLRFFEFAFRRRKYKSRS